MKRLVSRLLTAVYMDALFRRINRSKLLVLMYHGICKRGESSGLFTQLPFHLFSGQLEFLRRHYNIVSLKEVVACLREHRPFPQRAALITFDDGFKNNYTNAFPLLKSLNIPATIFLTVDYVGTKSLLWFDELYLLIKSGLESARDLKSFENVFACSAAGRSASRIYSVLAERYKRLAYDERIQKISNLREQVDWTDDAGVEAFRLLDWDQVGEMQRSGLVDFGVHTATHRILTELSADEWHREIVAPKETLSAFLNDEVESFCYPNGIPEVDFVEEHERFVQEAGYRCAFSTGEWLNERRGNPFRLGRIAVGSDMTSQEDIFRLNTSGCTEALRKLARR